MSFSLLSPQAKRLISFALALLMVFAIAEPLAATRVTATELIAEGADFVHRSDGVWFWPLSRDAYNRFTDWAGCNGDWSCYFHPGNNHGGCEAAHETSDGFGHNGIDIGVVETVYAMADGTAYTREDSIRGKYVIIEHPIGVGSDGRNWSYYSYYQHLSSFSVGNNVPVEVGTAIGVSGSTGASTGAHLHLGIVLGYSGSCDSLQSLENAGWITSAGFHRGRILNNPARNSPAGYPTGYYVSNVYAHAGSVMYTFNKNEVNIGENIPQVCNHDYVGTEKAPTCDANGLTTYTCSKCGDTYTETIPALGHAYNSIETAPTCNSSGYTTYTCTRCGDSYTEDPNESWSEWSSVYPDGISADLIQDRTEYRYRDKEFTTSNSEELPGWTLIGPTTIYGDYGAWSAWGDSPVSASDERKVETRTVWPYYYFLCGNCGAHMHGYGSCYTWAGGCGAPTYESGWREVWSTTSWDHAGFGDWYGTGKYYAYVDGQLVFQLTGVSSKTQYRYCTRQIIEGYSFCRWGEWSEWGDTSYESSDERIVETRTAYRYYTGPLAEHTWDGGVVTIEPACTEDGEKTYSCTVCDLTRTEVLPQTGHSYDHGYCVFCGDKDPNRTEVATGYSGALTWVLTDDGVLSFSGEGKMKNYTYKSEMPWYGYREQIISVVLEQGITSIGDYAFYGMPNLLSISIPESVTTIGNYAFKNCPVLDGVVLPGQLNKLGESAFYACSGLTAIEIPASLWTIQPYTFKNCTALAEVIFHEGNLMKISDGAFYNTAVTELVLPDCLSILDVYSFKNCAKLESITLGSGLSQIREAVFYGTAIPTIVIPEGVTSIGPYAFKNCVELETIDLPETLTSVGEASFYACTALQSLELPDAVTKIGNYAFRKCAELRRVTFSDSLVNIGESSFYGCESLYALDIPGNVTTIQGYAFKGCLNLGIVELPESLKTLGDSAFHTCTGLDEIIIPAGVTKVGEYCFSGSTGIDDIYFLGDAPAIGTGAFNKLTATAYYPGDNATWTANVMQNYGGKLTWKTN